MVPVFIREKDRLSIIATLREMQRVVRVSKSGCGPFTRSGAGF